MINARRLIGILILAILCTLVSTLVQRVGPTHLVEGEGFCPGREPCHVPALGAGFPLAWIVDNPQISVPHKISFIDDDVRGVPFVANVAFYAALITGIAGALRRATSKIKK